MHPLIEAMQGSLAEIVSPEPIEIRGAWSSATRIANGAQVNDARWSATVACAQPLAGLAFLQTGSALDWVKSPPARTDLSIALSLSAYADRATGMASLGASIGTSFLPGRAVPCGPELQAACVIGSAVAETGRAHVVAGVGATSFIVLLIPGELLKTGRNHLWRLRDALAADLPAVVRKLLTRGRSGSLPGD